jgi:hypothetical protein
MKPFPVETVLLVLIVTASRGLAAEGVPAVAGAGASTNGVGPKIEFASTVYDFGRVAAGGVVKHDFVFTNTGDALLEITGVYPSCGCTTAGAWTQQVEPGKTGTIPLQFNSARFSGPVAKTVTVAPKNQPAITLQIKGTIWKPIEVNPQTAVLNVVADSPTNPTAKVSIVSSLDEPITLSDPTSSNPAIGAELKTVEPGKRFEVLITPRTPLAQGNVQATISIKTSSTNVPTIDVSALAVVQPLLAVSPTQIALPPGPLSSAFPCTVSIRNNGSQPLTLSEAAVNAADVDAQIKEIQPGKQFAVNMTFPAGFRIASGDEVALGVTTSLPQMPVLKVPVRQAPRPPPGGTPAPGLHRGPPPPPVDVMPPAANQQ